MTGGLFFGYSGFGSSQKWTLQESSEYTAPINANPVGGGEVQARGVDLTKEPKVWSISKGLGSIHSSNVVKNPHPGAKYKIKDRLCMYF